MNERQDAKTPRRCIAQMAVSTQSLCRATGYTSPSDHLRDLESRLVGDLARQAHDAGQKFADWPKLTLAVEQPRFGDVLRLVAEVETVGAR